MNRLAQPVLLLIAALIVLPVLAVLASVLQWNAQSTQILAEMAATVLPQYALTSIALCLMVALGVGLLGAATACAVTLFDFKGRSFFEWALLLPLAMPAYVVAYAYTDFLQYAGPAQSFMRTALGLQGRVLPEVRSLGGAVLVFVFTLYPYVYLLARAALAERSTHLMEAARLLDCSCVQVQADRLVAAQQLANKLACTVILKGAGSIIVAPGQLPCINPTGNAKLATAGTGDVLAGLVGAALAGGLNSAAAACTAVYQHGLAASQWPAARGLTASALINI